MNIPLTNDQQLLEMFAKNKASKCCYMTLAYHKPNIDPPVIPSWDTTAKQSVEPTMTPSMPCPSFAEPSQTNSENADDAVLANPNLENEYVGVDEEGLFYVAQSHTWLFMHPPLLKSTAGRRKNRHKGALEGGSSRKTKRHKCPICHQLGHHWYTCKNGDPADIAAMKLER